MDRLRKILFSGLFWLVLGVPTTILAGHEFDEAVRKSLNEITDRMAALDPRSVDAGTRTLYLNQYNEAEKFLVGKGAVLTPEMIHSSASRFGFGPARVKAWGREMLLQSAFHRYSDLDGGCPTFMGTVEETD